MTFWGCETQAKTIRINREIPLQEQFREEGTTYLIKDKHDLQGDTIIIPFNSTLRFIKNGCIRNGVIIGKKTNIKYHRPFIGDNITIIGCLIEGKRFIKDIDVFLNVLHTQKEIQTLFDISGGKKLEFSQGVYKNIDKIDIKNSIDADFNNSIIHLFFNNEYVAECFYMEPWVDNNVNYVKIKNLRIEGKRTGINPKVPRSCIQLFHVSEIELDGITIDKFNGGPNVFKSDASDLLDKTLLGTNIINLINYDKCTIRNCSTNDVNKEIFWCVPNTNPNNITYFIGNKSTCSIGSGSGSFFTLLDGRCVIKSNEVHNYSGSAFNALCYDSEIFDNSFYDGKKSVAIDLSEGTMYRAKNVNIHDNHCYNTKGLVSAFGEGIRIKNNHWRNDIIQEGKRIYVFDINNRGKRETNGRYVGCDNNPETEYGSKDVVIENNECINLGGVKDEDIRFAILKGDSISLSHNIIKGFNVPVAHFVEGKELFFNSNFIDLSHDGRYSELYINYGNGITITNNHFSQNNTRNNMNCTVQIIVAEGRLTYAGNKINTETPRFVRDRVYIPCYIKDDSKLYSADIYVDNNDDSINMEPGLKSNNIRLSTNIKSNIKK